MSKLTEDTPNAGHNDVNLAILISLGRIYDLLLAIYSSSDPKGATQIVEMHKNGVMWMPPPAISEDIDDTDNTQ